MTGNSAKGLAGQRSASLRLAHKHLSQVGQPGMTPIGNAVAHSLALDALRAAVGLDEQIRGRWASGRGAGSKEAAA